MSERTKDILEWIYCIIIAVTIAILIKYFIGTPTVVKQKSMYPTLIQNERLILNRIPRTFNKMPKRGEIITFEAPSTTFVSKDDIDLENPVAKYDNEPQGIWNKFVYNVLEINKKSYIKRVIAVENEEVEITNGHVYIDGKLLDEPYLGEDVVTKLENGSNYNKFKVPKNCVFAMGDNRSESVDCRAFGCIPVDKIEGVVAVRFWPFNRMGKVK